MISGLLPLRDSSPESVVLSDPTSPQTNPRTPLYIPGLDGIRAIAFLMVFWKHALPNVTPFIPATLGVTIFFFLSGYLITTLLRRELESTGTLSLTRFYLRRTLRIFVPLYLVYAVAIVLARFVVHLPIGNGFGLASVLFYFHNYTLATGAHALVPPGMDVVWSLSVEEHFYLLFPIIMLTMTARRLTRRTQVRVLLAFCAIELLWRLALVTLLGQGQTGGWTYLATDARLDSILWGCILALNNNPVFFIKPAPPTTELSSRPEVHSLTVNRSGETCIPASATNHDTSILPRTHPLITFLAALALLTATLAIPSDLYRNTLRYTLQAMALYVLFSYIIANIHHPCVAWLEWRPLRYLGWTSYVLYLCHDFFIHAAERYFPGRLALSSLAAFAVSLAFATLVRYSLELPLQRLRARL
jgi:peptidoglycan/LPS O-acetylase OafA/YrhL